MTAKVQLLIHQAMQSGKIALQKTYHIRQNKRSFSGRTVRYANPRSIIYIYIIYSDIYIYQSG